MLYIYIWVEVLNLNLTGRQLSTDINVVFMPAGFDFFIGSHLGYFEEIVYRKLEKNIGYIFWGCQRWTTQKDLF